MAVEEECRHTDSKRTNQGQHLGTDVKVKWQVSICYNTELDLDLQAFINARLCCPHHISSQHTVILGDYK